MSKKGWLKPIVTGIGTGAVGGLIANQFPQSKEESPLAATNKPRMKTSVTPRSSKRKVVAKAAPEPYPKKRVARQKQLQAATSIAGGTLSLAALGALGRSGQLSRAAAHAPKAKKAALLADATKWRNRSTGLTTGGAGLGGLSAYNFASYTHAEGKKELKKNMEYPFMPYGEPDPFQEVAKFSLPRIRVKGGVLARTADRMTRKSARAQQAQKAAMRTYQPNLHASAKRTAAKPAQQAAEGTYRKNIQWSRNNAKVLPSAQTGKVTRHIPNPVYRSYKENPLPYQIGGTALGGTGATTGAVGLYRNRRRNQ